MKHFKKIAKFALALTILVAIVVGIFVWRDAATRDAIIASIREAGDPVSIAGLRPGEVGANDNAATFLVPVADELETLIGKIYTVALADFDPTMGLTDEQQQQVEKHFAEHVAVSRAIDLASHCEVLQWPLGYSSSSGDFNGGLLEHISTARNVARFYAAKCNTLAAGDDFDAAAVNCLQGLRMVRLQDATPTIVSSLVNTACRGALIDALVGLLKYHPLTPATHEAIEAELAQHDSLEPFIQSLKSERAFGISNFKSFPSILGMNPWVMSELANYIDFMTAQISRSDVLPYQLKSEETVKTTGLVDLAAPAVRAGREPYIRSIARMRCLRVLNAIESLPASSPIPSMGELGLPTEATIDPYSGDQLVIRKDEQRWTVYSVGANGVDDGGQVIGEETAPLDIGV